MFSEVRKLNALISRNVRCYFKDIFLFFISLLTPIILLFLFASFLRQIYVDQVTFILSQGGSEVSKRLINGFVASWLLSSIIGVSSVTVAFTSNLVMIQDKVNNSVVDFLVAPVRKSTLLVGYAISNFLVTLAVMSCVMVIGFIYIAIVGWYLSVVDVLLIILGTVVSVFFGTCLATLIGNFIKTEGVANALSALISALYGFICGAYMPLAQFSDTVKNILNYFPGTASIVILRKACLNGYIVEMETLNINEKIIDSLKEGFDYNLVMNKTNINVFGLYGIVIGFSILLIGVYVLSIYLKEKKIVKANKNK